jgi:hypothetical protein
MGPTCCPETSVKNGYYWLRNNREERYSLNKCSFTSSVQFSTTLGGIYYINGSVINV